jgi:hypothetical protein
MKSRGVDELHAVRFTASRTRGLCWQCVVGNPGTLRSDDNSLETEEKCGGSRFLFPWVGCRPMETLSKSVCRTNNLAQSVSLNS